MDGKKRFKNILLPKIFTLDKDIKDKEFTFSDILHNYIWEKNI